MHYIRVFIVLYDSIINDFFHNYPDISILLLLLFWYFLNSHLPTTDEYSQYKKTVLQRYVICKSDDTPDLQYFVVCQ